MADFIVGTGIAFEVGPLVVHWYGLLVVAGILVAVFVARREARRRGEDPAHVWSAALGCILLGFLGARLYHVLSTPANGVRGLWFYLENPIAVLWIWDGGLGIYGALAGGVLGLWLYARRHGLDVWRWLDIATPGLILAQSIGRWANFINQELYGPPTRLPWGLYIDAEHRIPRYSDLARYPTDTTRFHPTFLYEMLWLLLTFWLLRWIARRWAGRLRDGDLFLAYLMLYGLGRTWLMQWFRPEAWRLGDGLAVGTLVALVLVVGVGTVWWGGRERRTAD